VIRYLQLEAFGGDLTGIRKWIYVGPFCYGDGFWAYHVKAGLKGPVLCFDKQKCDHFSTWGYTKH
jgi:hypothetical protein